MAIIVADARKPKGIGDLSPGRNMGAVHRLQMLESRKALATRHNLRRVKVRGGRCRCSKAERHWRRPFVSDEERMLDVADARKPKGIGDTFPQSARATSATLQMLESRKALATLQVRHTSTFVAVADARKPKGIGDHCRQWPTKRHPRLQMLESRKALATNSVGTLRIMYVLLQMLESRKALATPVGVVYDNNCGGLQMLESRKALATFFHWRKR